MICVFPQQPFCEQCHPKIQVLLEPMNLTLFESRVPGNMTLSVGLDGLDREFTSVTGICVRKDLETSAHGDGGKQQEGQVCTHKPRPAQDWQRLSKLGRSFCEQCRSYRCFYPGLQTLKAT